MRARVTAKARDDFQTQYSSLLSSVETKSITSIIPGITYTHQTPVANRIQLLLSSLTISSNSCNEASHIKPIHQVDQIKTLLDSLQHLHLPANMAAPVEDEIRPSVLSANTDVDMIETLPNHVEVVERSTPSKRPHSPSSPNQSGSHRLVRRRMHNDDEDVIIQTGLNLHQPVQLQSSVSRDSDKLLSLLSSKGQSVRASTSADREQALRLIGAMSAQMAPPPIPATKNSDFQAPLSQVDSQSFSQSFQSQIPVAEAPAPRPVDRSASPRGVAAVHFEAKEITLRRINVPSNTPTSAQPEPLEVTQSSLPRVSSQRVPLPSHFEAPAASLATSSSHLLDGTSSSDSRPLHRAPSEQFIKYARRPIPKNQRKLLEKPASWWPARPGTKFPHPNIPVEDLNKIEKAAERRAAKVAESVRAKQIEEASGQEWRARLSNTPPVTQGTQDSVLSWGSSPEHHTEPRYRNDTLRRSTNIVELEPLENSQPDRLPLPRLLPGEYPPDSSAEYVQIDEPEEGEQIVRIPSSPPPDYSSDESYESDADDDAPPELNARQLPEYPLSSPEETSSKPDPEIQPAATELHSSVLVRTSLDESGPDVVDLASSPILEVAASPQPRERVEEPAIEFPAGNRDRIPIQQDSSQSRDVSSTNDQDQTDGDIAMDDQPAVRNNQVVDEKSQPIATDLAASGSQKDSSSGWGLKESAETTLQRGARMKREFFAQLKNVRDHENKGPPAPQPAVQPDDERKNLDVPAANTEPQSDPMEMDKSLAELAKPFDPNAVSRTDTTNQRRRQSDQINDHPMTVPGTELLGPAVSEAEVAAPTGSKIIAPGSTILDAVCLNESLPPRPLPADKAGLDKGAVNLLPPRPSHGADVHIRGSKSQIRQEIEKSRFGEPTRALWVGSLPASINNSQLKQIFAGFNPVSASAKIKSGFVNFTDVDTACRALEAKHNSWFDGRSIVCKFATPPGPALLTIDDLFRQLVDKRGFKGNRTAFETLCKNLHTSSDIPPSQWDNYVVLQPAEFLPWASRTIANGGKILDYDTYWHERLQKTVKPELVPVLTPARLDIVFGKAPVSKAPSKRSSAPVSPQTGSGARRPPSPPVHRTPAPTPPLAPMAVVDGFERSVDERNSSSATSMPQKVIPTKAQPFLDLPEPLRASKWLRQNFRKDPNGRVVQRELYNMYKDEFVGSTVPPIAGGLFVEHVFNTYPGRTVSELDEDGNKTFYCTGLRHKLPPRPPPADNGPSEFKIKGSSALTSVRKSNPGVIPDGSQSSPGERDRRPPRRSLPFRAEQRSSRSRSPPRNPPPRAPRGKPFSPDHLLTDEVLDFSF